MPADHDPAPEAIREDWTCTHSAENRVLPGRMAARALWKGLRKVTLFLVSLWLFVLAIELLKSGARGVAPLIEGHFDVDSLPNALGFGWLLAYLVMSGSPVAAATLAFFDAGAASNRNLALFMFAILVVPLMLMLI